MTTTTTMSEVNIDRALQIPDLRWPFESELRWLAERAREHREIVEIGSFLGRSTVAMAANTQGAVWAVDDWYGPRDVEMLPEERVILYDEFLKNVVGLPVVPIRIDHSSILWSLRDLQVTAVDMVFIDGSHEYADVHRDISVWKDRLVAGGLLCGHDRNEPGVRRALDELLPGWRPVSDDTLLWEWKKEYAMPGGLRRISVDDLKLNGTANQFPKTDTRKLEWKQVGGTVPRRIGLAVMVPAVTRNEDGSLRYSPPEWGIGLALLAPLANCSHLILSIKDMPRDEARSALVKQACSHGARYGLFLDDDVVPPPDALQKLQYVLENADDDVAVCAGIYTTKSDPAVPLVFQDHGIGPYWRWKRGDVFECQAIATGCMMIRLSAFDSLPEPWFVDVHGTEQAKSLGLYTPEGAPLATEWTDDMFFCKRIRDAGLRLMAHGGVLCDHWGQNGRVYRLASDSYPMRGV